MNFRTKIIAISLISASLAISLGGYFIGISQGVPVSFWRTYQTAEVKFDDDGIPTIKAKTWEKLIEAHGFVVASERMWQLDLMRRKAYGRLSEFFGESALEYDIKKRRQDWIEIANKAAIKMSPEQKKYCDAYAKGINDFIRRYDGSLGVEYLLAGVEAEPWKCADSVSIMMLMAEQLTSTADRELRQSIWRTELSSSWENFIFPKEHPWNIPLFGKASGKSLALPPKSEWLTSGSFQPPQFSENILLEHDPVGSNSWAWRQGSNVGSSAKNSEISKQSEVPETLLANDPHLGTSVPALWYAVRLQISKSEWVVGASLPGIPGVTLGMNQNLAWAFTNSGEDVDDYLEEKINANGQYLRVLNGKKVWLDFERKTETIQIKGSKEKTIEALYTDLGPAQINPIDGKWYSRSWLALKPDRIQLPTLALNQAKNLTEFNNAIDEMVLPSQNVLFADRHGTVGYRLSGIGISRSQESLLSTPASAAKELWTYQPRAQRLRKIFSPEIENNLVLATANHRIWIDSHKHHFADDARQSRINQILSSKSKVNPLDVSELQNDTQSRYHKIVLDWILSHRKPIDNREVKAFKKWEKWDGDSKSDHKIFSQLVSVEKKLAKLLLAQVRKKLLPKQYQKLQYWCPLRRAWMLKIMETPNGMNVFGLEDSKVANWLVNEMLNSENQRPHYYKNRWQAQHPFVGRIPIIGDLFRVAEYPQYGYRNLVKVEKAKFGASMRLVWNLKEPSKSTWIFPLGQSGHVASKHYKDLQQRWHEEKTMPVFSNNEDWVF